MSVDMFVKIDSIKGESKDGEHENEIDVLAWSFGANQTGTAHSGGGAGAGKVNVKDLSFTHYVDKASTDLLLFCCSGKHVAESTLTVRKAGESPLTYLKLTMSDCLISSVQSGGSGDGDRLMENVTLNFSKFKMEYTPQKADGTGDAAMTMGWDIAKNQKV